MLSKLHNSVVALTLLLGLVGTPKIVTSSELKDVSPTTTLAQANTEEIAPDTSEERRGISWYWLLLLLIPLGLGGLLLARRNQSGVAVEGREDGLYSATNANVRTPTPDNSLSPLDSSQNVNANFTSNGTTKINRVEDKTILTAYDSVGEPEIEARSELIADANESNSAVSGTRHSEDSTEKPEIASSSNNTSQNSEVTDQEMRELFSELERSADSDTEISLEEITFEESSENLVDNSDADAGIFDWLETLDDSPKDNNLDENSEWLDGLDNAEPSNDLDFAVTNNDAYDSLSGNKEELFISDELTFQELEDLLDEDLERYKER